MSICKVDMKKNQRVEDFKDWISLVHSTEWYNLSDTILREALDDYNKKHPGINLPKFWS